MLTVVAMLTAALAAVLVSGPHPARARLARVSSRFAEPGRRSAGSDAATVRGSATGWTGLADPGAADRPGFLGSRRGRAIAAVVAGLGAAVFVGGTAGAAAGAAAGVGAWVGLGRLEPAARSRQREQMRAMLPLAADLLAAAISAGCPPVNAVEQVGRSLGGPLGGALTTAAAVARIGSDPARAWSGLAADPALKPLGRALGSAVIRGVSPVHALQRVAQDGREVARWSAEARARSVGARAAAPLGLCFLPAFVLLGIVPVVVSSGVGIP